MGGDDEQADLERPELPPGRHVWLPGRGRTFVRELAGPAGAPTIVLLHGWTASADLNFYTCYESLGEHFRVLSFDHRGHGHGIRSRRRFRLEDCADDVAELLAAVDAAPAIAVGYSMGGAVAQLLWRRHPEAVRGLVLAATAAQFKARYNDRLSFLGLRGLARLARLTPAQVRMFLSNQLYLGRRTADWAPWAVDEASNHDWADDDGDVYDDQHLEVFDHDMHDGGEPDEPQRRSIIDYVVL